MTSYYSTEVQLPVRTLPHAASLRTIILRNNTFSDTFRPLSRFKYDLDGRIKNSAHFLRNSRFASYQIIHSSHIRVNSMLRTEGFVKVMNIPDYSSYFHSRRIPSVHSITPYQNYQELNMNSTDSWWLRKVHLTLFGRFLERDMF